jgi:hypothetical protein
MKYQIDYRPEDNTYLAQIWTGPDGIDDATFVCGSLGECFEKFVKYEAINGLTYSDSPAAGIRKYFESVNYKDKPTSQFTKEELEIIQKCKASPLYFIRNYVSLNHTPNIDYNYIPRDYQEELIEAFEENKITLGNMCRQSGKSLTPVVYAFAKMAFNPNYIVLFKEFNDYSSNLAIKRVKHIYENLPDFLKRYIGSYKLTIGGNNFVLENGSTFCIGDVIYNSKARNIDLTILSEFAFWKREVALKTLDVVIPIISSRKTNKMIMLSTPNTSHILNEKYELIKQHFYDIWTNKNIAAKRITVPYTRVYTQDQIADIRKALGHKSFGQEYNCLFLWTL